MRSITGSMMLKSAAFTPVPSASMSTAIAVKPGVRRIMRNAYFTSCRRSETKADECSRTTAPARLGISRRSKPDRSPA